MAGEAAVMQRSRVALYGAGGLAATTLVASAFVVSREGVNTAVSILAALGPAISLGFIGGLAAKYPCRAMPLRRSSALRIVLTQAASAAVASGFWILVWQSWLRTLLQATGITVVVDFTLLFGLGVLIYLMAVAMHYLVLEIDAAREAEETALRYQVLAREAELRAFKAQV